MVHHIPEGDLVDLAAELDMAVPEVIDRESLVAEAIDRLADLGRREGLPLSSYDQDDLEALPAAHLRAFAALLGTAPDVRSVLKAGKKVYKTYRKTRPNSQVALMLPTLLGPLARYAAEGR